MGVPLPITLELDVTAGTTVEDAVAAAIHVARVNSCWTEFSFNGVCVSACGDDNRFTLARNVRTAIHRGADYASGYVVLLGPDGQDGYPEEGA